MSKELDQRDVRVKDALLRAHHRLLREEEDLAYELAQVRKALNTLSRNVREGRWYELESVLTEDDIASLCNTDSDGLKEVLS